MVYFVSFILIAVLLCFAGKSRNDAAPRDIKSSAERYLSGFKMYVCIPHRIIFFPPKEIYIGKSCYTLNLTVNSSLLAHRNINSELFSGDSSVCTECIKRCTPESGCIVPLNMSFEAFRRLTDEELYEHLKKQLTEAQPNDLFDSQK